LDAKYRKKVRVETPAARAMSSIVVASNNQSEQTCSFTNKDTDLTGTCKGERGSVTIAGKIEGKTVSWQFHTEYEGQKLTPVYTGTIESAEKIVGTVDVQGMGLSGEFTATKAK
jgi:hypothetical protein